MPQPRVATPAPVKQAPVQQVAPTQVAVALPSSKQELLTAVGIEQSQWQYVDEILTRESNWRPQAVNASSGATGLCQSLPAQKMASAGADYMTNPVTQLKWCNEYAKQYGGWQKAAEFSRCVGQCYSSKVGRIVTKDHRWW